jgi:hypothetical protein
MKNKDLDTYINERLEQGKGLPYKEEYWSDMNTLLDAEMPASQSAPPAAKATTTGLKLLYLSSVCAAIFAASYTYTHIFNTPAPSTVINPSAQTKLPTIPSETAAPDLLQQPFESAETPTEKAPVNGEHTIIETPGNTVMDNLNTNANETTPDNSIIEANKSATFQPVPRGVGSIKNNINSAAAEVTLTTPLPLPEKTEAIPAIPSAASSFAAQSVEAMVTSRYADFFYIAPLTTETSTELHGMNHTKMMLMAYPRRNRFIQHIALSPFIGVVLESGSQTHRTGNIDYKHAAQSHYTYGLNLECATGRFGLRTGIGTSQTVLQTSAVSSKDIYIVDTTFVVLNPNYGTTPSGKPIALVKQEIDSSYSYSQQTTARGSTQYQYLTIPLTLQYRMAYKRILVVLEGGALHHFRIAQQNNSPILTSGSDNPVVLPTYNLQLTAGSSLRYAISSKWAVGVQYNYCLSPSSANLLFLSNAHVATLMLTRTIR